MDKYLLEILNNKNTIIIPGLGALTITNKTTGKIKFIPHLTHDDDTLSRHISKLEGIEENDAKNLIAKYVREILAELDKGESYDMYEFGSFFKNGNEIEFKNWENHQNQKNDSKEKAEPVNDNPRQEYLTVKTVEPESNTAEKEEKTRATEVTNETKAPKKKKQNLTIIQKEELSSNEQKLEELKEKNNNNSAKKKKGAGFWMLLSLILLIVLGGVYIASNYDEVKQHIPFLADEQSPKDYDGPEKMKETIGQNDAASSIEEELIVAEPIQENEEKNENVHKELKEEPFVEKDVSNDATTPPAAQRPFHIIAGAFSSKSNANTLGNKLRAKGYDVKVGRGRGMHLVSIKSFATHTEAKQALAKFKEVAPNGWVFEWK